MNPSHPICNLAIAESGIHRIDSVLLSVRMLTILVGDSEACGRMVVALTGEAKVVGLWASFSVLHLTARVERKQDRDFAYVNRNCCAYLPVAVRARKKVP